MPQLSPKEIDLIRTLAGKGELSTEIVKKLGALRKKQAKALRVKPGGRARKPVAPPDVTTVRSLVKAKTHRAGVTEKRGRKRILTKRMILKMNRVRKSLYKKAAGEKEVRWKDISKSARAPKTHRSTVARSFDREGLNVRRRPPRSKPRCTAGNAKQRIQVCKQLVMRTFAFS